MPNAGALFREVVKAFGFGETMKQKVAEDQYVAAFAAECKRKHGVKNLSFEIEMAMRVAFTAGWNQGWECGAQRGWSKKTNEIKMAVGLFDSPPEA
jgi:hypothetical protein